MRAVAPFAESLSRRSGFALGRRVSGLGVAPVAAAMLMALAGQGQSAHAQVTYRTVALQNTSAPGTGASFGGFNAAVINNAGNTAFNASLVVGPGSGATFSNNVGLWSEGFGGSLSLVARSGTTPAPGAGSATFTTFGTGNTPVLNDNGQVAFFSNLAGMAVTSGVNSAGIWSQDSLGGLGLVIRAGSAAPGTTGFFNGFSAPRFNNAGQVAFVGTLATGPGSGANVNNDSGIWRQTSVAFGTLALVAREGSPAVGVPGLNYSPLSATNSPTLNNSGQTAFSTALSAPGARANYSEGGGSLAVLGVNGVAAPGTSETFVFPSSPIINNSGRSAFFSTLSSGTGIWTASNGSTPAVTLVARNGDPVISAGAGVNLGTIDGASLRFNGADRVAFTSALSGSGTAAGNNFAVLAQGSSGLSVIARAGSAAPGTGAGVLFGTSFTSLSFNNVGQVAFIANLVGSGIGPGSGNSSGLWATDLSGGLQLVARTGDLFDVNSSTSITDNRTISLITYTASSGGQDGQGRGLNDAGQLVFNLTFTDGTSGVFVATIPTPGALGLLGVASLAALRRRRR